MFSKVSFPLKTLLLPLLSANFRILPEEVHTRALATLANHFMKGQCFLGQLQEIEEKCVAIHIIDVAKELRFVFRNGALVPSSSGEVPYVTIQGALRDLLLLATRREDPDTLFFQRRLALKGDVAIGLMIKNLLDSIEYDWDAHVNSVLGAAGRPLAQPLRWCGGALARVI